MRVLSRAGNPKKKPARGETGKALEFAWAPRASKSPAAVSGAGRNFARLEFLPYPAFAVPTSATEMRPRNSPPHACACSFSALNLYLTGMCNLYSLTKSQEAMRALTGAMRDETGNLPPLPGIFPDMMAPVVRTGSDGQRDTG